MLRQWGCFTLIVLFLSGISPPAWANCAETPRKVQLGKKDIAELKSYECSIGATQPQIKVETFQLNDISASLVIGGGSSKLLKKTLGNYRILKNEVYENFSELLQKFGITEEKPKDPEEDYAPSLVITGPNPEVLAYA